MKITNRLFILAELEKLKEKKKNIVCSQFTTVEELKENRSKEKASKRVKFLKYPRIQAFSQIKVANEISTNGKYSQHGRSHPS